MASNYKNLDITPGTTSVFPFEILDSNYLKVNLTGCTCKLEILDNNNKLIFTSIDPSSTSLGLVVFTISDTANRVLVEGLYKYRLVIIKPDLTSNVYYKGFVAVSMPEFNLTDNAYNNVITLPDGTIYANSAITISPGAWYAVSSTYRFLASGIGVFVIDGRDLHGITWNNLSVYNSVSLDETRWIPELNGMTAFRVKLVAGNATIRYLP